MNVPLGVSDFSCSGRQVLPEACERRGLYGLQDGRPFCVLHHPSVTKQNEFDVVLRELMAAGNDDFAGVWFPGDVSFRDFRFRGRANFSDAHFEGAVDFSNAYFPRGATFRGARFRRDAHFCASTFRDNEWTWKMGSRVERDEADFYRAVFQGRAVFSGAEFFPDTVNFAKCEFHGEADFSGASLHNGHESGLVDFRAALFRDSVTFGAAKIDDANFSGTRVDGRADFRNAVFLSDIRLDDTVFGESVDFSAARFQGRPKFHGARFHASASFHGTAFEGGARFDGAVFMGDVDFCRARFRWDAVFGRQPSEEGHSNRGTTFCKAGVFSCANFERHADFRGAIFRGATRLDRAGFAGDVDFTGTELSFGVDLSGARFGSCVRFAWKTNVGFTDRPPSINLANALVKSPEHMSFHSVQLRPRWLIDIDVRRCEFIDVDWGSQRLGDEVKMLREQGVGAAYSALSTAYSGLAGNAEENHRYSEASRFRYMAMEARRRERGFGIRSFGLEFWYWLVSGWGERAGRAVAVLAMIWLVAAWLYTQIGFVRWEPVRRDETVGVAAARDKIGAPLEASRALTYSLGVIMLQRPEPRPVSRAGQAVVLLETVLGPVQGALSALAIRRKFIRR